ncbi:MAG: hypothetical protein JOZ16_14270 [Methylobacteriaceae bacterium]|nr:hypothetical protein [Methylobacteriaceae bacterium]
MREVDALERDVEAARARLVNRVAQLKGAPVNGVKDGLVAEAAGYKDEVIDSARQKVTGAIDGFVSDLKRRATDNPVAVAAIGAGIAYRLWQKPPIATLLVGAGVAALFGRSSMREIDIDPYDADRPGAYVPGGVAGYGYERTRDQIEQKAIGGATVALETARDTADALRQRATELKDNALRSAVELMDSARDTAERLKRDAVRSSGHAVETAASYANDARVHIGPARDYAEDIMRDNGVYLGLAALAIGAAAGIGVMQMNKPLPDDADYLEGEDIRVE